MKLTQYSYLVFLYQSKLAVYTWTTHLYPTEQCQTFYSYPWLQEAFLRQSGMKVNRKINRIDRIQFESAHTVLWILIWWSFEQHWIAIQVSIYDLFCFTEPICTGYWAALSSFVAAVISCESLKADCRMFCSECVSCYELEKSCWYSMEVSLIEFNTVARIEEDSVEQL